MQVNNQRSYRATAENPHAAHRVLDVDGHGARHPVRHRLRLLRQRAAGPLTAVPRAEPADRWPGEARHDDHQTRTTRPVPDPAPGSLSAHPGHHRQPARGSAGSTLRAEVPGPPRGRRHHGGGTGRAGCRRGGRAGRGDRVVRGARSPALALDPRCRPARIGVHGCVRDHAAPAARGAPLSGPTRRQIQSRIQTGAARRSGRGNRRWHRSSRSRAGASRARAAARATRLARRLAAGRRPAPGPPPRGRTRPAGIWLQPASGRRLCRECPCRPR
jgi:hypothetical protein